MATIGPDLLANLHDRLAANRTAILGLTVAETGFSSQDSEDLFEAALAVARAFLAGYGDQDGHAASHPTMSQERGLALVRRPFGGVAILLPQNACLYLGLLAGLSALSAGNDVWLKPPSASAGTADLLESLFDGHLQVSRLGGREFMDWTLTEPQVRLVHFIGSSRVGSQYIGPLFDRGKQALVDGDGNVFAYVGESADPVQATTFIAEGALRFNGQTCTAVKGAVVHDKHFETVQARLVTAFQAATCGCGPLIDPEDIMGVVLDSQGSVLTGGPGDDGEWSPVLVKDPLEGSQLVREGVFAPVVWLRKGSVSDFARAWQQNRFPLCAAAYTQDGAEARNLASMPNLARLTLNGDPSLEEPLEPWGAYPASGNGEVRPWTDRYRRTVQLDLTERDRHFLL